MIPVRDCSRHARFQVVERIRLGFARSVGHCPVGGFQSWCFNRILLIVGFAYGFGGLLNGLGDDLGRGRLIRELSIGGTFSGGVGRRGGVLEGVSGPAIGSLGTLGAIGICAACYSLRPLGGILLPPTAQPP